MKRDILLKAFEPHVMKVFVLLILVLLHVVSFAQTVPRPEHPRPDLRRDEWLNLNGQWEFAETDDDNDRSWLDPGKVYPDKIKVPFCRESRLSGLGRTGFVRNVWYRKTIQRPKSWKSAQTMLNIGASDWTTTVYINGTSKSHTGGSTPIRLVDEDRHFQNGPVTVVVHCFDDTRSGLQALGKQCPELKSYGCLYTRTTGIWQTVWLEGVGQSTVSNIKILPNIKSGSFKVSASVEDEGQETQMRVRSFDNGKEVARNTVQVQNGAANLDIKIPHPKLWEPGAPHLYDIEFTTLRNGKVSDKVMTYAGLREVTRNGHVVLINGKPVFQRLVLDQGYYPDGVWTAPSDKALKDDILKSMAVGFNGARLHQKVFEPRFLYWADKLGYLVWGEYTSWGLKYGDERIEGPVSNEWTAILARDFNHPSIIGWCPFNETPNEAGEIQKRIVKVTRDIDPTRPVIDTSGYIHSVDNPDILDAHDYNQDPVSFKKKWDSVFLGTSLPTRYGGTSVPDVPFMVSEYGGIGWDANGGWGYGEGPKSLEEFYSRFKGLTDALLDNPNMFAFCYTQLTDVEQEKNGIYRYDRTAKFDAKRIRTILTRRAAIELGTVPSKPEAIHKWSVLVGSCRDALAAPWRSTTQKPVDGWERQAFDDSMWRLSHGGFGNKGGFEKDVRTPWTTDDIWLRQSFEWSGHEIKGASLAVHYDNATEVYVNGALVWASQPGAWNDGYEEVELTSALRKALRSGTNVIAVHCHQDTGGQFIDLALLVR